MKSKLVLAVVFVVALLSGCATVSSKEAYIACGAADVVTTGIGISMGTIVETNPVTNALHIGALGETIGTVVPIISMLWLIWHFLVAVDEPVLTGSVTAVECGAAIYNLGFLL